MEFSKGTRYSLRAGQPTGISHGMAVNPSDEFDALTRLAHSQADDDYSRHRSVRGEGTSRVVPKGQLYSRSMQNIAFNRELVGVLMFPAVQVPGDPMNALGDIINGWIVKIIMDAMGAGTDMCLPIYVSIYSMYRLIKEIHCIIQVLRAERLMY